MAEIVVSSDGDQLVSIRGREAASAFQAVLRRSLQHVDDVTYFDVRWLKVPDVYVSALWLGGPRSLFLPTRLGAATRPDIEQMPWPALRERVLGLIEVARTQPSAEFVERDGGSPR